MPSPVTAWELLCAGLPFILVNTLCGAFAAYGFSGLRYTPAAIVLYGVIMLLQSLIAIQVLVFCVYVTSNQVSAYLGDPSAANQAASTRRITSLH